MLFFLNYSKRHRVRQTSSKITVARADVIIHVSSMTSEHCLLSVTNAASHVIYNSTVYIAGWLTVHGGSMHFGKQPMTSQVNNRCVVYTCITFDSSHFRWVWIPKF